MRLLVQFALLICFFLVNNNKCSAFTLFGYNFGTDYDHIHHYVESGEDQVCKVGDACCAGSGGCEVCKTGDAICEASAKVPKLANEFGKPREAEKGCEDRHEQCKQFHRQGECNKSPGWMIVNCPLSCKACNLRDPKIRCPREILNMSLTPSYQPGDMDQMFEGLVDRFSGKYEITVLSRDPWVVTIDNFLSDSEGKALISTVATWERSTDTGSVNDFGEAGRMLSQGRTSSNAWCGKTCMENPQVQSISKKIEEVTGIPTKNSENYQVLRYETGQKYNPHHDCGPDDAKKPCGPRILTFFLYLSDVEEGGETNFPLLDIAVTPKKGRALLWPSTLSHDPEQTDHRTLHEAKPVIKGKKFAANSWIHLYDFQQPNLWGCTGSFDEL